jgi:hypothetical protein
MNNQALPLPMRLGAAAALNQYEQNAPQALQQIEEVRNKTAELDTDIILDQSFDTINVQAEQLDEIIKFGAAQSMDILDLIDLSNITGKENLIERIENRRKEAAQAQGQNPQASLLQAKAQEAAASAQHEQQKAIQAGIESQMLKQGAMNIPLKGNVSI